MKKVFFLLCLFAVCVFADNIHMKNGKVYSNVFVTDKTKYEVIFMFKGQKVSVPLDEVLRIELMPILPNVMPDSGSTVSVSTVNEAKQTPNLSLPKLTVFSVPNENLLLLSILSGLVSWDCFAQVNDLKDTIGEIDKINSKLKTSISTSALSDTKSRKQTIAVISALVCLVTTYISFTPMEITISPTALSLSYHF